MRGKAREMTQDKRNELQGGFETAYIDASHTSNLAYKPQFISNNYKLGRKVLSSIEDELLVCERLYIFIVILERLFNCSNAFGSLKFK